MFSFGVILINRDRQETHVRSYGLRGVGGWCGRNRLIRLYRHSHRQGISHAGGAVYFLVVLVRYRCFNVKISSNVSWC